LDIEPVFYYEDGFGRALSIEMMKSPKRASIMAFALRATKELKFNIAGIIRRAGQLSQDHPSFCIAKHCKYEFDQQPFALINRYAGFGDSFPVITPDKHYRSFYMYLQYRHDIKTTSRFFHQVLLAQL
jgi:hypothetical protein